MSQTSTNQILDEIVESTSRYSGLILNQLEMTYPQSPQRDLFRRALLNALGERGLIAELRAILKCSDRIHSPSKQENKHEV